MALLLPDFFSRARHGIHSARDIRQDLVPALQDDPLRAGADLRLRGSLAFLEGDLFFCSANGCLSKIRLSEVSPHRCTWLEQSI